MRRFAKIPLALIAAGFSFHVMADDVTDLKQEVDQLKQQVHQLQQGTPSQNADQDDSVSKDDLNGARSDLENFKYQYNRDREYNTAQTTRPVLITGLAQLRYQADNTANGNTATPNSTTSNKRYSSFSNGNLALQFSGLLFKDYDEGRNLAYNLRFASNPNAAIGPNATGNLYTQFANLSYNFRPTLSPEDPRLTLTLGQQLIPFGLDAAAPDELRPTINPAQFVSALAPNFDTGLLLRGEAGVQYDYAYSYRAPIFVYYLGLINGTGANTVDNNGGKDLFGRAVFTVPSDYNSWLRQLAFGASIYRGKQNTSLANGTETGSGAKNRTGFDVYYDHNPFGFTYEYIRGEDAHSIGTTVAAADDKIINSTGKTLTFYWNIGEQFLYNASALGTTPVSTGRFDDWWPKSYQFFARFDQYNPSIGENGATWGYKQNITSVGFNAFFAQTTKFQLNITSTDNDNSKHRHDNELLAQFQYGF